MSYARLVIHTNRGVVTSSVHPEEQFDDLAVNRVVEGIRETGATVDGYDVVAISEPEDGVVVTFPDGKPF